MSSLTTLIMRLARAGKRDGGSCIHMVKMMLIDCGNLSSLSYLTPHMLHERIELDEDGGEREGGS